MFVKSERIRSIGHTSYFVGLTRDKKRQFTALHSTVFLSKERFCPKSEAESAHKRHKWSSSDENSEGEDRAFTTKCINHEGKGSVLLAIVPVPNKDFDSICNSSFVEEERSAKVDLPPRKAFHGGPNSLPQVLQRWM